MFTTIELHYLGLKNDEAKKIFKKKVIKDTGISESTFYRILKNEPGKILKEYLSKQTGIKIQHLYHTIDPILTPNTTNK